MIKRVLLFWIVHLYVFLMLSSAQTEEKLRSSLTFQSEYVVVNNLNNWVLNQASYSYDVDSLTWIGRVRHARRFQRNGTFVSAVAYPEFSKNMYAYMMIGTSPDKSEIYPGFRLSATLFRKVAKALVIGPGIQYIRAGSDNVYIYGLTANFYKGTYLLIGNPSVQFLNGKKSLTITGSLRKYFDGANSFVSVTVGGGQNPENTFFNDDFQNTFNSFFTSARIQYLLNKRFVLRAGIKIRSEKFSSGTKRFQTGFQAGITYKF